MATKATTATRRGSTAVTTTPDAPPAGGSGITVPDVDPDEELLPRGIYIEGEDIPDDRVVLFHLEGKVYTAPKILPPNIVFKFMRRMRGGNADMATFWLIEQLLGEHTVDTLADHDELTDDELDQIMKVVRKHTMGAMEKAAGK